jgi:hypothetical protein
MKAYEMTASDLKSVATEWRFPDWVTLPILPVWLDRSLPNVIREPAAVEAGKLGYDASNVLGSPEGEPHLIWLGQTLEICNVDVTDAEMRIMLVRPKT